jgi:hypothetical protein
MKHEWKKLEKNLYLPKNKPEKIFIPKLNYFSIKGKGNPNDDFFPDYIKVLYSLSYSIRMSYKTNYIPENFYEYTVYPLEGIWDIDENAKSNYNGILDKNSLIFNLMIRQPDFVTQDFASQIIEVTKQKNPQKLLEEVKFETIEENNCVQMLHLGSYDSEPESFKKMELFALGLNLKRKSQVHREIYLTDPRKTTADKLKTVLRFQVE